MQIKTKMKEYFTSTGTRMKKMDNTNKNMGNNMHWGPCDVEKREPSYIAGGGVKCAIALASSLAIV